MFLVVALAVAVSGIPASAASSARWAPDRSRVTTVTVASTWRPFSAAELASRYGSVSAYVSAYGSLLDRLIDHGRVLSSDRAGILAFVTTLYNAAPTA